MNGDEGNQGVHYSESETARERTQRRRPSLFTRAVLYPTVYPWFVFLAALDIMMTWTVLTLVGPEAEANALANWVVKRWGLAGMVVYKFVLVFGIVCICEVVGRRNHHTGRKLAEWSVAITAIPVVLAFVQLLFALHVLGHGT